MALFTNMLRLVANKCMEVPLRCSYHILTQSKSFLTSLEPTYTYNDQISTILKPVTALLLPSCGFKVAGKLRRRCKDCYFVRREGRLYVICEKHPRHKQMSMVKQEKNTWILTHATQGKFRQW